MQTNLKPWQIGVGVVLVLGVCFILFQSLAAQSPRALLPKDVPAGPLAATRTPQPDELVGAVLSNRANK